MAFTAAAGCQIHLSAIAFQHHNQKVSSWWFDVKAKMAFAAAAAVVARCCQQIRILNICDVTQTGP